MAEWKRKMIKVKNVKKYKATIPFFFYGGDFYVFGLVDFDQKKKKVEEMG